MKKQFLTLMCAVFSLTAMSQVNEHAIGMRLGGGNYFGAEASYQRGLSNINRIEADLGLYSYSNGSGFNLAGIYHWVWNIESGFNWYAGPGAQIGSWAYRNGYDDGRSTGVYLGVGGQVGVEYNFDEIPLNLSIDSRPMFGIGNTYNDFYFGISIAARYVF